MPLFFGTFMSVSLSFCSLQCPEFIFVNCPRKEILSKYNTAIASGKLNDILAVQKF